MRSRSVPLLLLGLLLAAGCGRGGDALSSPGGDRSAPPPPVAGGPAPPAGPPSGGNVSADGAEEVPASTGVGGRATTTSGEPVAGATVVRTPVDPERPVTQEAAVTGPDGRYAWTLPPGVWDVTVEAPRHVPLTQRVTVVEGERAQLDFVLTRR